eukprot:sb/3471298/
MDVPVEYEDDNELFDEIVSEIKRETILTNNETLSPTAATEVEGPVVAIESTGENDDWVDVLVPYTSLQQHMSHKGAEVDVSREEIREKVLEMYGQSKIEAFPLKLRAEDTTPAEEVEVEVEADVVVETSPSAQLGAGKLFIPAKGRKERSSIDHQVYYEEKHSGFWGYGIAITVEFSSNGSFPQYI